MIFLTNSETESHILFHFGGRIAEEANTPVTNLHFSCLFEVISESPSENKGTLVNVRFLSLVNRNLQQLFKKNLLIEEWTNYKIKTITAILR